MKILQRKKLKALRSLSGRNLLVFSALGFGLIACEALPTQYDIMSKPGVSEDVFAADAATCTQVVNKTSFPTPDKRHYYIDRTKTNTDNKLMQAFGGPILYAMGRSEQRHAAFVSCMNAIGYEKRPLMLSEYQTMLFMDGDEKADYLYEIVSKPAPVE